MKQGKKDTQPLTTTQQLGSLIKSSRDIMRKDKGLSGDLDRLPMLTWIMFLKFLDDLEQIREHEAAMAGKKFRKAIESPYRWRDWAAKEDGITGNELTAFINNEEAIRPDGKKGPGLFAYLRSLQSSNGGDRRDVIATVFKGITNRMISGYLLRDIINKINGIHFNSSGEIHTLSHLYESMLKEMRDSAGDSGEFYTPRPVVRFMVEVIDPQLGETVLDPACGTGGFLVESFNHLEKQCKTVQNRKILQTNSILGGEAKPLPYLLAQMNLLLHGLEYPRIDPLNSLRFPLREIGDKDRVDVILTNPPFGGEEERGILGNFPEDKQTAETALLFLQLIMRKLRRPPKPGRAGVVVPESVMGDVGVAQRIRQEIVETYNLHTVVRLPRGVFEPYSDIQTNLLFFDCSHKTEGIWFYQLEVPVERRSMRNPCYTRTYPLRYEELESALAWWGNRKEMDAAWYVPKSEIVARGYSFDFRNPNLIGGEYAGPTSIVSAIKRPLDRASNSLAGLVSKAKSFEPLLNGKSFRRTLGTFLARVRHEATVEPEQVYKQITVKLYGNGVVLRQMTLGQDIRTRPQFMAQAGQLIMSRIDARNGAFGLVPTELDGALVSQDFPLFEINASVVEPGFLALLLRSHQFAEACKRASRGTTNRKRLKEDLFLAETVPVPPLDFQRKVVDLLGLVRSTVTDVLTAASAAEEAIPALANYIFE
jgi:type I restriction enzyme M protein